MRNVMCYDNKTVKWTHNSVSYCLHIQQQPTCDVDPRDYDHNSIMACFGGYHNYGDQIEEDTAKEFWQKLVFDYCSDEEICDALKEKKLIDTCIDYYQDAESGAYYYILCDIIRDERGNKHAGDCLADYLRGGDIVVTAIPQLSIDDCMILMKDHAVWLPLWVYDHSGVSMSCGSRTYPYNDQWDSSLAGWIITPLTANHTEKDKQDAIKYLTEEVKEYDGWLQGEVYRYTLYEQKFSDFDENSTDIPEPTWEEIDSCGGFIGDDMIENGLAYNAGHGLEGALKNGGCVIGTARKIVTVTWEF